MKTNAIQVIHHMPQRIVAFVERLVFASVYHLRG